MTATATDPSAQGYLARAENWLDSKGKMAWIAAMVLSFIIFWPLGLALLFYMIWSKRMFKSGCSSYRRNHFRSTGNTAFDAYKADTLRRLEEEQNAFQEFLDRLREAKDKAEFDQFMDDREARARRDRTSAQEGETVEA